MAIFVNDAEISDSDIAQEMQYHPAPSREQAWQGAAQSLVIRELLLQRATDAGLRGDTGQDTAGDQEEVVIDKLLQQDVSVPTADGPTCRRFYDQHPDSFVDEASGERLAFEQAHGQIRDYLHTRAMRIAVAEYIKALSNEAIIKGFSL
jgi:hypothetical protein